MAEPAQETKVGIVPAIGSPGCAIRVNSKGASFWIRRLAGPGTTTWATAFRLAGVKSISGPNWKRSGKIDATELQPANPTYTAQAAGVIPGDTIDENFFYIGTLPGTKEVEAIKLELNMNWAAYLTLLTMYNNDEVFQAYVLFRTGDKFLFDPTCYVESMETTFAENALVQTPVEIQPTFRMLYLPSGQALPANFAAVTV